VRDLEDKHDLAANQIKELKQLKKKKNQEVQVDGPSKT